ncbi:hypothetical protein J1N35_007121 [Gossypium stocksii]|uniref:DUF4371 domain-containing protein n=1 Tax=Gossypium stocksii TaxID=47602 RepID=A0A9D4AF96_9ROSI|nr:hypothetical protein J1N35_007121 [Gossypium stocksii]
MINRFLNLLLLVEKNQILDLPKLLNMISSLPKLLNEITGLLNPKILNEISSLPKLLNEISASQVPERPHIRGQRYDGASNMHGEWNELQALFAKKCRFAYYVHYIAHRLQLTLVAASKEVIPICHFFSYLTSIINLVASLSKRHDKLRDIEASHIVELIDSDIIKSNNLTQSSETDAIYDAMTSVEFVFILHFMIVMLGITDELCQALQYKS